MSALATPPEDAHRQHARIGGRGLRPCRDPQADMTEGWPLALNGEGQDLSPARLGIDAASVLPVLNLDRYSGNGLRPHLHLEQKGSGVPSAEESQLGLARRPPED